MERQTRLLLAASALVLTMALPGHVMASDGLEDDLDSNGKSVVAEKIQKEQEKDNTSGGWSSWLPWNWGGEAGSKKKDDVDPSSQLADDNQDERAAEGLLKREEASEFEAEKLLLEEERKKKEEQFLSLFGGKNLTKSVFLTAKEAIGDIADLGDTQNLSYQERSITLQKGTKVRLYDELMYFATNGNQTYIFSGESYKRKDLNKYLGGSVQNVLVRYENGTRYQSSGTTFRPNIQYAVKSTHSGAIKIVDGTDVVNLIEGSGLEFRGPYLMTHHAQ